MSHSYQVVRPGFKPTVWLQSLPLIHNHKLKWKSYNMNYFSLNWPLVQGLWLVQHPLSKSFYKFRSLWFKKNATSLEPIAWTHNLKGWRDHRSYTLYYSPFHHIVKETEVQASSSICPKIVKQIVATRHEHTQEELRKEKNPSFEKKIHTWVHPIYFILSQHILFISHY